uniref:Uncharacterized protein n=1 Tax=Glossina palpalis gambiensis TaxID=67801 RepID=A0A1B0ASV2_9MUSC
CHWRRFQSLPQSEVYHVARVECQLNRIYPIDDCLLSLDVRLQAVEKICDFLVGITVLRGINFVITPPTVSIPKVSGLTSSKTIASVSCSPDRTPACIRVEPPTKTISCTSFLFISASSKTFCTGFKVERNKSIFNSSNLARVNVSEKSSPSKNDSISKRTCNSSGSWLINDAHDIQAGNDASIFRGLTLSIIKVRWHGNDGSSNRGACVRKVYLKQRSLQKFIIMI